MKDVSALLDKRLKRLEGPFSRDWIADFSSFMEFAQTNPSTLQILESIKQQKEEAHVPLMRDLKGLLHEGAICLREIQRTVQGNSDVEVLVDSLLKMKVNPKKLEDPFFELESLYNEILCRLCFPLENPCARRSKHVHLKILSFELHEATRHRSCEY